MSKALAGHSQSTHDYKTNNVDGFIIARYYSDNSASNVISLVLYYILQTPHARAKTGVV